MSNKWTILQRVRKELFGEHDGHLITKAAGTS